MKVDGWLNFAAATRLVHRPQLVTLVPHGAVFFEEHWLAIRTVKANLLEEGRTQFGILGTPRYIGATVGHARLTIADEIEVDDD